MGPYSSARAVSKKFVTKKFRPIDLNTAWKLNQKKRDMEAHFVD